MDPPHHHAPASSGPSATIDPLFDPLNALESTHFEAGHAEGFAHGALHGTFEGRALGQEKAFELWEELGYMEGVANGWLQVVHGQQEQQQEGRPGIKVSARSRANAESLLALIAGFPTLNPSSSAELTDADATKGAAGKTEDDEGPDLALLLERCRAKFRLLCAGLGVKARLATAAPTARSNALAEDEAQEDAAPVEGVMRF